MKIENRNSKSENRKLEISRWPRERRSCSRFSFFDFRSSAVILLVTAGAGRASAQASQTANDRLKEAESAQAKSWKQVDEINGQADRTMTRLHQSRQSGEQAVHAPASVMTKQKMGVASPYRKIQPRKAAVKPAPKKKAAS